MTFFSLLVAAFQSFVSGSAVPLFQPEPSLEFEAPGGQLFPEEAGAVRVRVASADTVDVRVRKRPLSLPLLREDWDESVREERAASRPIWTRRFVRTRDSLSTWNLSLDLAQLSRQAQGEFLDVEVLAPPAGLRLPEGTSDCDTLRTNKGFLVGRLGLFASRVGSGRPRVLVLDLRTGAPVPKARVSVHDLEGKLLRQGVADAEGEVELSLLDGVVVVAHAQGMQARMPLEPEHGDEEDSDQEGRWGSGDAEMDSLVRPRVFGYLLRGVHRPGDTLVVGMAVVSKSGIRPKDALVRVYGTGGDVLDSVRAALSRDGHGQARLVLPQAMSTGRARAEIVCGGTRETVGFSVETQRARRLQNELVVGLDTSGTRPRVVVRLKSSWYSGRSAAGLAVRLRATWYDHDQEACGLPAGFPATNLVLRAAQKLDTVLDERGELSWSPEMPSGLQAMGRARLELSGSVFEAEGVSVPVHGAKAWKWGVLPGLKLEAHASQVRLEAKLLDPRCRPVKKTAMRLLVRHGLETLIDTVVHHGDVVLWSPERFRSRLRDSLGSVDLEVRLCVSDTQLCREEFLRLGWVRSNGVRVPRFEESYRSGIAQAQETPAPSDSSGQEGRPLRPGERVRVEWESPRNGLALVQVVQGGQELWREIVPCRRGMMRWSRRVEPSWDPGVDVFVSEVLVRTSGKDSARIQQASRRFKVRRPDRLLEVGIELADSLRPLRTNRVHLVNRSGVAGSVVLAAIDLGILDLDGFRMPDIESFLDEEEEPSCLWWKGLGRFGSKWWLNRSALNCRENGLLGGKGGIGWGSGRMALGAGGTGKSISTRARLQAERMRQQGQPMAWVSPVLAFPPEGVWVDVPVPAYTGAVRLEAVAVAEGRLGQAEREATVTSPLEIVASLPRQMAPGDTARVGVHVLGAKPSTRLRLEASGSLGLVGGPECALSLREGGGVCEATVVAGAEPGEAWFEARAWDGTDSMNLPIPVKITEERRQGYDRRRLVTQDGEAFLAPDRRFLGSGLEARLELSSRGPVGAMARLQELLRYPHGCLEQTTSAAYPQLFLAELFPGMAAKDTLAAHANVQAAIRRLESFQRDDGMLSLWPGGEAYPWGTLWAAGFLQEARTRGYEIPASLWGRLVRAIDLGAGFHAPGERSQRLVFLAKEGRLWEDSLRAAKAEGTVARWQLAQAWKLFASRNPLVRDTMAMSLARSVGPWRFPKERELGGTLRTEPGEQAKVLEAMAEVGWTQGRDSLASILGASLSGNGWLTTQEIALSLRALARLSRSRDTASDTGVWVRPGAGAWQRVSLVEGRLVMDPGPVDSIRLCFPNALGRRLDALLSRSGILREAQDMRDSGLGLQVEWLHDGKVDSTVPVLAVRTDLTARVTVRNLSGHFLPNTAFTLWLPGGWEARNARLDSSLARTGALLSLDIREDRVVQHFDLPAGETRVLEIPLRAVTPGAWQGPEARLDVLYDGTLLARRTFGRTRVTK